MKILNYVVTTLAALLICVSAQAQQYSKITYVHSDPDGTAFAATDEQGNVEWKIEHFPFGREFENTSQDRKSDISFAGKPYDEEIGLSYFGGRWYDPDAGRFTGIDSVPVLSNDFKTFNRYAYGFNNPYKYVDPDGNLAFLIPLAIWGGNALLVAGAGYSGYEVGSNGYDLYSGRKTVGEAAQGAALGVVEGAVLKGVGGALVKYGRKLDAVQDIKDGLTKVRHHTNPDGLNGIKNDGAINTSRGNGEGVHVELPPFGNAKTAGSDVGAAIPSQRGFVEFKVDSNSIINTNGDNIGPRNTGLIPAKNKLKINTKKVKFKKR